jgi:fucose permease
MDTLEQKNTSKRNFYILTLVIFASYTIFGISESVKGPAIPRMQTDLSISEWQIGLLLATNALGYLIACGFTAPLARRLGMKPVLFISLGVISVSGIGIAYSKSFLMLAVTFFIMYLANGMLEIALGISAAVIFTENTGKMLNFAHGFYGIGCVIGPICSAGLMAIKVDGHAFGWRYMYMIVLASALIPIVLGLFGKLKGKAEGGRPGGELKTYLKNPIAWCVIIILSFGSMCEVGMGSWLANYMEKAKDLSPELAAVALTAFFLVFTVARLILAPFVDRIGLVNSLIYSNGFAAICVLVGVFTGNVGIFIVIASGIGVAPLYPTVLAVVAKQFQSVIDTAMTVTMTAMGIISLPINLILGGVIEVSKIGFTKAYGDAGLAMAYGAGLVFLSLCCAAAFAAALTLRKLLIKNNTLV